MDLHVLELLPDLLELFGSQVVHEVPQDDLALFLKAELPRFTQNRFVQTPNSYYLELEHHPSQRDQAEEAAHDISKAIYNPLLDLLHLERPKRGSEPLVL